MLAWSQRNGILRLFSGSTAKLYRVYRRFNQTARVLSPLPSRCPQADPLQDRYFEKLRAYGGKTLLFTFEVAGAAPWRVFSQLLPGLVRVRRRS